MMSLDEAQEILLNWHQKGRHTFPSVETLKELLGISWEEWEEAHRVHVEAAGDMKPIIEAAEKEKK